MRCKHCGWHQLSLRKTDENGKLTVRCFKCEQSYTRKPLARFYNLEEARLFMLKYKSTGSVQ